MPTKTQHMPLLKNIEVPCFGGDFKEQTKQTKDYHYFHLASQMGHNHSNTADHSEALQL